ncbi:MAG: hypothetical protein GEV28_00170 [Actinophytocola sp.]|uniref:fluoroquinolone export ABC transporter permease subunit n=1 Tax=Actinophytocola sp. TaxID=1872138 RepID=UPI00132B5AF3|nr:hypothetical protein [Actinophytocola sp.]MPZ78886.1 hypothetical protein [Actinophytocola sp.]
MTAASTPVRRSGRILRRAIWWDLRLLLRYQVVTVAVAVAVLYVVLFRAVPALRTDAVAVTFIFADPMMIGFLFVGVMVLFERDANTLQAVVVTPLSPSQYLWSKAISLTLLALPGSLAIAIAAHDIGLNPVFLVGLVGSSVMFVFVGFVAVSRVRSVNEYLLIAPIYLVPGAVPVLAVHGILNSPFQYVFPTKATLVLLQAGFATPPLWQLLYAVAFLGVSAVGAFAWARHAFEVHVRRPGAR